MLKSPKTSSLPADVIIAKRSGGEASQDVQARIPWKGGAQDAIYQAARIGQEQPEAVLHNYNDRLLAGWNQ